MTPSLMNETLKKFFFSSQMTLLNAKKRHFLIAVWTVKNPAPMIMTTTTKKKKIIKQLKISFEGHTST